MEDKLKNLAENIEENAAETAEASEVVEEVKDELTPEPEPVKEVSEVEIKEQPIIEKQLTTEPEKKTRHPFRTFLIVVFVILVAVAAAFLTFENEIRDLFDTISKVRSGEYEVLVTKKVDPDEQERDALESEKKRTEEKLASSVLDYDGDNMEAKLRNVIYLLHDAQINLDSDDKNAFSFTKAYNYNEKLYSEKTLTNFEKNELLLFRLREEGKFVKVDSFLSESEISAHNELHENDELRQINKDIYVSIFGVQKEIVAKFYKKMFGEEITHGEDLTICGSVLYDEALGIYYNPGAGGCGGVVTTGYAAYMTNFRLEETTAKVDVYVGEYDTATEELELTVENYENYPKYTFDFEVNEDGTYKFLRVE